MRTEQDGNPQVHLALAKWCKMMSSWFEQRAAYHAAKSENPLAELEIPVKPKNPAPGDLYRNRVLAID